jgi:AcrR family transcriptional regulator
VEQALSLEKIVSAAVDLLDAEGLDGLKMRRLADRLGAGAMSLYWHVDNKEKVLDLALDAVLSITPSPSSEDWRKDIVNMLEDWRACMLRHPWSASLLPHRALSPNLLKRLDLLGETLSRGGVNDADLNAAIWSLWNLTMGATITRASFPVAKAGPAPRTVDASASRYPTLNRTRLLHDDNWDSVFRRGLMIVLEGLAQGRRAP